MKKIQKSGVTVTLFLLAFLLCRQVPLYAQTPIGVEKGLRICGFTTERSGDDLLVEMDIDISSVSVKSNNELVLTPLIGKNGDSIAMAPVVVAGRNRYYHFIRKNHQLGEGAVLYRKGSSRSVTYKASVPYDAWMSNAKLFARWTEDGCCTDPKTGLVQLTAFHFEPKKFVPDFFYVQPPVVEKEDSAERTAHIIFIVDKTDIDYERQQNIEELEKIRRTIDSLRNDRDYTITSLTVKGYASPESPYAHNRDLAEGRTETLKAYIMQQYHFPSGLIATDAEPEDWAGLERYVEKLSLANRDAILALIRTPLDLDKKEDIIKKTFPQDYRYLLQNVYPGLRRSEYKVKYKIRHFTDVEEIKRALKTEPGKLSLDEIFMATQTMETGSHEFMEAFRTAVVMFPHDPIANLNAANAAMERGELAEAKRCLDKAGDTPEVVYAKGIYAALNGQNEEAERLFTEAERNGVHKAKGALEQLREIAEEK